MKNIFYCFLIITFLLIPYSALIATDSHSLDYFSMGYYYLYNNELIMAKIQFEFCLLTEKSPPPLLYTILSEISDMLGEQEEAMEYATRALELDPENETALRMKSLLLIEEKEYEEAVIYLEKLLEQKPDDLQLLYYGAEVYTELDENNKLIDIYIKILQINPRSINIRLNLGYLLTKQGLFGLAEKEYKQVLELDPDNEKAVLYLTYIYIYEGKIEEVSKYFNKLDNKNLLNDDLLEDYASILFIDGQDPWPILRKVKNREDVTGLTRAIMFFEEGKIDEAKEYFEMDVRDNSYSIAGYVGLIRIAEIKNNPDMEKKWRFVLAGSYYNLQNFDKSLDEALRVKELDSSFLENIYLLGDIYNNLGMEEKAIAEYEYFKNHSQEKGDVHIKLGIAYDEIGDHQESIRNFREALELFPDNDELYYYLGIEYRILQEYEQAVGIFKKAVELKPDNAFYNFNLGASFERLGNIDDAIFYLDKSVRLDDNNAMALNYLGYILADTGIRLDEAKGYIEKALLLNPENGAYLDSMGWVLYKLSEYNHAKEYLENAVEHIDSSDAENYLVYDHLGDTYYKVGLMLEAINSWKEALKMKFVNEIQQKIEKLEKELGN